MPISSIATARAATRCRCPDRGSSRWSPRAPDDSGDRQAPRLGILTTIADRVPALGDPRGWHARFGRELNATDDRPHFVSRCRARSDAPADRRRQAPVSRSRWISRIDAAIPVQGRGPAAQSATTFDRVRARLPRRRQRHQPADADRRDAAAQTLSTHTVFCLKTASMTSRSGACSAC